MIRLQQSATVIHKYSQPQLSTQGCHHRVYWTEQPLSCSTLMRRTTKLLITKQNKSYHKSRTSMVVCVPVLSTDMSPNPLSGYHHY